MLRHYGQILPAKIAKRRSAPSRTARRSTFAQITDSSLRNVLAVPSYPLAEFRQAKLQIELPIAPRSRGTPPQPHSRRHAMVGSKPLEPQNETLRCATQYSVAHLCPSAGC